MIALTKLNSIFNLQKREFLNLSKSDKEEKLYNMDRKIEAALFINTSKRSKRPFLITSLVLKFRNSLLKKTEF